MKHLCLIVLGAVVIASPIAMGDTDTPTTTSSPVAIAHAVKVVDIGLEIRNVGEAGQSARIGTGPVPTLGQSQPSACRGWYISRQAPDPSGQKFQSRNSRPACYPNRAGDGHYPCRKLSHGCVVIGSNW